MGNKSDYKAKKSQAVRDAINWQIWASMQNLSLWEICRKQAYFKKLAKRYGLIKEFKENGII